MSQLTELVFECMHYNPITKRFKLDRKIHIGLIDFSTTAV